jgi:pimeloyl-ACP methyl ester carboxylesterase
MRHHLPYIGALVIAIGAGLIGVGPASVSAASTTTTTPPSHPYACSGTSCSGLVVVGHGRTIYVECQGTGSPTVVLVAGQGERAENWSQLPDGNSMAPSPNAVYPQVSQFTRVCAYDRPGTTTETPSGFVKTSSSLAAQPVTPKRSAADLTALLKAVGQRGPFVLAGQSYGGDIIRIYASEHPKQTAGLVLVDALSEHLADYLSPQQLVDLQKVNSPATQGRPPGSEYLDFDTTFAQLRKARVPKVPVTVLTADTWLLTPDAVASKGLPRSFSDVLWSAQRKAQARLADVFPGATWITKTNASHYIQLDQPQLVTNSIREVVDQVRKKSNPASVNLIANPNPPVIPPSAIDEYDP